jgi:predicted phage baseplate assembly protein
MIYSCCNENRKSAALGSSVNGIDYLEVLDHEALLLGASPRQRTLLVHCLNPIDPIAADWKTSNILIEGGESITGITASWVAPAKSPPLLQTTPQEQQYFTTLSDSANVLVIRTSVAGDFSPYTLRLVNDATTAAEAPFEITGVLTGFDSQLAEVQFSFKVECGPDFDCAPQLPNCPPEAPAPPPINYLAKDYGSFRTTILDRLSQLLPNWAGTSEADLGVALTELMAYVGDHLSYQQDAVATEAYIETARSRISLRRHALLVDYHVKDGCNSRVWVTVAVSGKPGAPLFLDRSVTRFYTDSAGVPVDLKVGDPNQEANAEAALANGVVVFQPMCDAVLYPELNQISFYTWGDTNCCLPQGATEATLLTSLTNLQSGDVLIFQEMKGPQTGVAGDADIRHRCAVRLTNVATQDSKGNPLIDPLFNDPATGLPAQVTEIQWSPEDALPFPACISSTFLASTGDHTSVSDVSVAFGNVVLADQGLSLSGTPLGTVPAPRLFYPPNLAVDRCTLAKPTPLPVRFRPLISDSPLTQAVPLSVVALPNIGNPVTTAVLPLDANGLVSLPNSSGFACLTLQTTDPAGWPQFFGVKVNPNTVTPANFDLSLIYNPPGGLKQITLEVFTDLDPTSAVTQINSVSNFIEVTPGSTSPSGYPATPVMLSNAGPVSLQDLNNNTYLTIQAVNPETWPPLFGVSAQPSADPKYFDLQVLYNPQPSVSIGVTLPVTVETFTGLSTSTAASSIDGNSELITVQSFAQTPDSSLSASAIINFDPTGAVPAITLTGTVNGITETWNALPDLLESGESDPVFVVEIEYTGAATLRFGDSVNGKAPDQDTSFVAAYRIGNGTAGNVGTDSVTNFVGDPRITSCTNPLPATGGTDPETNDQIRRRAPQAFLTQERAVTMTDYQNVTETDPLVDQAVATLRWTGSWYTVFIAVEPAGGGNLTPTLQKALKQNVERYRLAGQDLELDSPQYLSLQIELDVCVDPGYFQRDVQQGLLQVLGSGTMANGQKGFFYPDNFNFGQTVYLSPIYAAVRSVAGVVSVTATIFQPQGVNSASYLTAGEIKLGPLQVARLANDPSYPNHGQLTLNMEGGK